MSSAPGRIKVNVAQSATRVSARRQRLFWSAAATVSVGALMLVWLYPVIMSVMTSLKTDAEVRGNPIGLPSAPSFNAFVRAWQVINLGTLLRNSVILAVGGSVLSLILCFPLAYFIARRLVPFANALFAFLLVGLMVPQQMVIIPLYNLAASVGLTGSLWGLIIIHGIYGIPFALLVFRGFFAAIPRSLDESARIDGCSDLGVLRRIVLPLSVPAIMTVATLQFINIWNEFFFAVIFLSDASTQPVTVGILPITQSQYFSSWNLPAAALILAQIPTVLLYIAAQRYIVSGLTSGAVKG